ncbi:hypothetical protein [Luteolibacter luteus]|uniref:DUF695 domain-containing protein n=1 Tax=Luteolibacter luteus TaxID=2728835 RepID=A0A858RGR0_9BACT|nr:hypothetical protein [Luteolibacter luteus]QJE95771.1 hypothetical protein HHL09_08220 [Luteolibacter luteus]
MSIFSRLFKKPEAEAEEQAVELTFKERVESFWAWFSSVSDRFYQTIESEGTRPLIDEISTKVDELFPGMAWVFGPGEKGEGHSLTLSGEGILTKQLLAAYWLSRAPRLNGWTFYAARQPSDDPGGFSIRMGELTFKPIEFWVTPEIDEENEHLDLTVWHPLADKVDDNLRQTALFLVLDEILGEFGTGRWIGSMEFSQKQLGRSMPISELTSFIEETRAERGWKMWTPGETWMSYGIPPEKMSDTGPRLDTIAGSTACWNPLRDFLDGDEEIPFDGFHADWIYLAFDTRALPSEATVDAREAMADVISEDLTKALSGRPLGGAIGRSKSYIDFLIYDGSRSIGIIREAARRAGLPENTRLEYLANSKRNSGMPLFGN